MLENLKEIIKKNFSFRPNKNQLKDIERLCFEIIQRENTTLEEIIKYLKKIPEIKKQAGRNKFFAIKNNLIKRRFPLTNEREKIDTKRVFLPKVKKPLKENWQGKKEFRPLKIFVEKEVRNSYLLNNFKRVFPDIEIEELNYYTEYLKKEKFKISILKKPLVFIIKEKWDFFKPCPCTKYHLRCGYFILNLGMGCPFDCSYCFLQQYTNFPGIVLPANLEDFFTQFDNFLKKIKRPIRLGTGEFCDSLALDYITEYSLKLIPYFKNKNAFFELKTKSNCIDNLLKLTPSCNTVVSFSLNPNTLVEKEEIATSSLKERLTAAKKLQEKGYQIGLHFDPIIYYPNWEEEYFQLIKDVYTCLKRPFCWISLGLLRGNRELKVISEARFPESKIFYGELFLGEDKKLRYPKFLRREIYQKMITWIREFDQNTPVYLCMEDKQMWQIIKDVSTQKDIENYLLKL
jgi:spore photoproduct lyase